MRAIVEYTNGKSGILSGSREEIMLAARTDGDHVLKVIFECPTCKQMGHHAYGCNEYDKARARDSKRIL